MILFLVLLFVALSDIVTVASESTRLQKPYYVLSDAENIYQKYLVQYGKSYCNEKDYQIRFEIFKQKLGQINKWNAMYPLTAFDINEFSDYMTKEILERYLGLATNTRRRGYDLVNYVANGTAPEELDYRKQGLVTEVKQQADCGSCYVFSAIGNVEGQYAKKYGKLVSLSEQQCLDCHLKAYGCQGGWMHETMQALASEGGSMAEKDYPYNGKDFNSNTCKFEKNKIAVKVTNGNQFNVTGEEDLKDALANIGPLSIAIYASEEFMSYKAGIFTAPCGDVEGPNHGVVLVGYGSEGGVDYWIIKNSWSSDWGEEGYVRFQKGTQLCLIGSYVATATVS